MNTYLVTFTETIEVDADNAALAIAKSWDPDPTNTRVVQSKRVRSVERLIPQPPLVQTIEVSEWGEYRNWGGQE